MGTGHLIKRSVTLKGHRTSVSLEPEFWAVLDGEAVRRGFPTSRLITEIDLERGEKPLASALRLAALNFLRQAPSGGIPGDI